MIEIKEYSNFYNDKIEKFREQTFLEGNDSLSYQKFKPNDIDGKIFICLLDDEIISISAIERSHYTGDNDVARICRYHILKEHRLSYCGFKMLPYQVEWAKNNNFKMIYWTHDVENKALNALYQHKKKFAFGAKTEYFDDEIFLNFKLIDSLRFKVSEKSDMLQYIYAYKIDPGFNWCPLKCVINI